MSHALAIVIMDGSIPPENVVGHVECYMEPYWELDLDQSEAAHDPRSEFSLEIPEEELEALHHQFILDRGMVKGMLTSYSDPVYWAEEYHGYVYEEPHGGWGYWHNPKAKWDWYSIGGRWGDFFTTREGPADYARVKEFAPAELATMSSFAVIDKTGEWHERATLGWFGLSTPHKDQWDELENIEIPISSWKESMEQEWLPGTRKICPEEEDDLEQLMLQYFEVDEEKGVYRLLEGVKPLQEVDDAIEYDKVNDPSWSYPCAQGSQARKVSMLFELIYDLLWETNFYKTFLADLSEDDWLVAVDYHI